MNSPKIVWDDRCPCPATGFDSRSTPLYHLYFETLSTAESC